MDLEKIEQLVKIVEKSSMLEFNYREGDIDIFMSRKGEEGVISTPNVAVKAQVEAVAQEGEEECYINSPIVGTFYAASSPLEKPFVEVGDVVKSGQTVCVLEAMKLMNEIESDFDCEIEAILVSNEQKVEYGQPLFRVRKLQD
jgi:acetyl-CoA carboxylase, biotin carboxyl carrier protein